MELVADFIGESNRHCCAASKGGKTVDTSAPGTRVGRPVSTVSVARGISAPHALVWREAIAGMAMSRAAYLWHGTGRIHS
jgi:hypothetical protein